MTKEQKHLEIALEHMELGTSHLAIGMRELTMAGRGEVHKDEMVRLLGLLTATYINEAQKLLVELQRRGVYTPPREAFDMLANYDPKTYSEAAKWVKQGGGRS